ncbi:MAG: hypothetical protein V4580_11275 [Bacteroidota bacterium]
MKLLTEDLLKEYGFTEKPHNSTRHIVKIMSRDKMDVVIRDDGIYYSNLGIDYPIRDTSGLRKLYKELKGEELKAVE